MIRLDYRTGSGELEKLFRPWGVKVQKTKLDFGDADFFGNGPKGLSAVVVERKRIEDLIQSMQSRRLSGHQLPGMALQYDYCYLIVEGLWRPGDEGELETHNGSGWNSGHGKAIHYRAVDSYLATLELQAGVIYRRTASPRETVVTIVDLYRHWNDKLWSQHRAHEAVYAPGEARQGRRLTLAPRKVGLVEKMAMQLPGVDSKAREVARKFASVREMVMAGEEEWLEVEGIGKVGAKRIVEAMK